jgi:hypothetical protein
MDWGHNLHIALKREIRVFFKYFKKNIKLISYIIRNVLSGRNYLPNEKK